MGDIIQTNILQNPYQEFTFAIPAAANGLNRMRVNYATNYFRVLSLSLNTLSVNFGGAGIASNIIGAGIGVKMTDAIPFVELTNTGASDLTVTIALGIVDEINDNRFVLTSTINVSNVSGTTLSDVADVAVLTTATTKVSTGTANDKSVIISNLIANGTVLRVGTSSAGAARGAEIPIGGSVTLDCSADVYIYNPSGGTINVGVLRVRA